MQHAPLALCLAFISTLGWASNNKTKNGDLTVATTIDHVVVYQQGAQVERIAEVELAAGLSTVVFEDLNTAIDPAQIRLTGNGPFQVLSITHRYQTDTLSGASSAEQRNAFQVQRNALQKRINELNTQNVIFDREEQLLLNNQGFTVKDSGVDLERLIRASEFFRERFEAIQTGRLNLGKEIAQIQEEMYAIDRDMGALPPLTLETSLEVIVNVEASRAAEGKLLLSYWMNNAGWNPSYNARVSDITEPLKLEYQAMVYQNTGESWEGVGLSIATGTPSKNRSKPQLQPWSLDGAAAQQLGQSTANAWLKAKPYNPNVNQIRGQLYDANGQPLIGAQVTVGGNRAVTDINGFYSIGVPAGVSTVQYQSIGRRVETLNVSDPVMNVSLTDVDVMMDAVMIAEEVADEREALFSPRAKRRSEFNANESMDFAPVAVEHNPTQTRFDVSAHYDIPADGQPHAVRVLEHQLPVDYLYQCTPKLDPQVYLTALFTDWEELDLINGRMHIYFEDDYVGESQLRLDFTEDTLAISLGPDPSIQVRRKRTMREDRSSLISGKREFVREYVFTTTNRKEATVHIQIDDQLPIANNEEIEINRLKLDGAEVDKATGRVIWDLEVKPGDEVKRTFRYEVKSPKELYVRMN
jgi:hypothetical protein